MDNTEHIEPWPEPVDGKELLNKVKDYFVTYPEEIQHLAPLWVMASYFDKKLTPLGGHRTALRLMLKAVPPSGREEFLTLLRNMTHPKFRPLIDQRLAELPGKSALN